MLRSSAVLKSYESEFRAKEELMLKDTVNNERAHRERERERE